MKTDVLGPFLKIFAGSNQTMNANRARIKCCLEQKRQIYQFYSR